MVSTCHGVPCAMAPPQHGAWLKKVANLQIWRLNADLAVHHAWPVASSCERAPARQISLRAAKFAPSAFFEPPNLQEGTLIVGYL